MFMCPWQYEKDVLKKLRGPLDGTSALQGFEISTVDIGSGERSTALIAFTFFQLILNP